jgi:hypothetical protein
VAGGLCVELTPRGRSAAVEAFTANAYIGPLPLSLAAYSARIRQQAIRQELVQPQTVARALHPLAISDEPLAKVVIAVDLGALDPALRRAWQRQDLDR